MSHYPKNGNIFNLIGAFTENSIKLAWTTFLLYYPPTNLFNKWPYAILLSNAIKNNIGNSILWMFPLYILTSAELSQINGCIYGIYDKSYNIWNSHNQACRPYLSLNTQFSKRPFTFCIYVWDIKWYPWRSGEKGALGKIVFPVWYYDDTLSISISRQICANKIRSDTKANEQTHQYKNIGRKYLFWSLHSFLYVRLMSSTTM